MDGMVPQPREEKLPVWARKLLASLRWNVVTAQERERHAVLDTHPNESDTVLTRFGSALPIGLGVRPTISFLDRPGGDWLNGFDVRNDDVGIYVAQVSGRGLAVHPSASNSVRIVARA